MWKSGMRSLMRRFFFSAVRNDAEIWLSAFCHAQCWTSHARATRSIYEDYRALIAPPRNPAKGCKRKGILPVAPLSPRTLTRKMRRALTVYRADFRTFRSPPPLSPRYALSKNWEIYRLHCRQLRIANKAYRCRFQFAGRNFRGTRNIVIKFLEQLRFIQYIFRCLQKIFIIIMYRTYKNKFIIKIQYAHARVHILYPVRARSIYIAEISQIISTFKFKNYWMYCKENNFTCWKVGKKSRPLCETGI